PPAVQERGEEVWVVERSAQAQQMSSEYDAEDALLLPADETQRQRRTLAVRGTNVTQQQLQQLQPSKVAPAMQEMPGSGTLVAKLADKLVPIPLKHTDVKASIAGYIATVDVTQQYHNPYSEKIEAIYVF